MIVLKNENFSLYFQVIMDQFKHPCDLHTHVNLLVQITTRTPFCSQKGQIYIYTVFTQLNAALTQTPQKQTKILINTALE